MGRTKIDAINSCLRGIGIAPVVTEDDDDLDASTASNTIDEVAHSLQSRGWWFNKEGNWKLTPDSITGFISVPPSAISIVPTGDSWGQGLVIRGQYIYDTVNHTNDLRERAISGANDIIYVEFTFITELQWNDLPPVFRSAVTFTSRRLFAQDSEVDKDRWTFQSRDEKSANIALLREDSRNKRRNSFRDNASISGFLSRVSGANANSAVYGYPKRDSWII